jgi:hypothetical protein
MAKLEAYRQAVREVLGKYGSYKPINGEIEVQTIFDSEHDHYQIFNVGWDNNRRVHGCSIHIDIKPDCKVWIQANNTEVQIADELMELGVAREDIVLGFHDAYMRQFTEFAIN